MTSRPDSMLIDPTRTALQRAALLRDITRRMNSIKREVTKLLVTDDVFGMRIPNDQPRLMINASGCGAGRPGDPGFQPGNTCGGGTRGLELFVRSKYPGIKIFNLGEGEDYVRL